MASNNLNEGVGKKIVEALRMQVQEESVKQTEDNTSDEANLIEETLPEPLAIDIEEPQISQQSVVETTSDMQLQEPAISTVQESEISKNITPEKNNVLSTPQTIIQTPEPEQKPVSELQMKIQSQLQFQAATQAQPQSFIDNAFNHSLAQNLGASINITEDFELPANVAVLRQLINRLPAGVSKQTGALIIKQTMEALGISMGGVLQEAKQIQENFINNSKECQNNIVEYRKQIGILENKAQQYQKQANAMNDIITLFIQTSR